MEKIIDYKIVMGVSHLDLENRVNDAIKTGYIPQGGVCSDDNYYFQAMIKYEVKPLHLIL